MAAGAGQVLYADPASPEIRLWAGLEEKGGRLPFQQTGIASVWMRPITI